MSKASRADLMLRIVAEIKQESKCERASVAALLTDSSYERIINFGYNGHVRGGSNHCVSLAPGACGCIHAEVNALIKPRTENPYAIFCSTMPCMECAKLIINAGIKEVFYKIPYRKMAPTENLFNTHSIFYEGPEHEQQCENNP